MDERQQNANPNPIETTGAFSTQKPTATYAPTPPTAAPAEQISTTEPATPAAPINQVLTAPQQAQYQQTQDHFQAATQINSKYKVKSLKSITAHFVISFLVINFLVGVIGGFLVGLFSSILPTAISGSIIDGTSSSADNFLLAAVIITTFVAVTLAVTLLLTMLSIFRIYRIQAAIAQKLIRNIKIFFVVLLAFQFIMNLVDKNNIFHNVISIAIYAGVLFGMMTYVKKQVDKASI